MSNSCTSTRARSGPFKGGSGGGGGAGGASPAKAELIGPASKRARAATIEEIEANLDFSQELVRFLVADVDRPLAPDALAALSAAFEDLRHVQVEIESDTGEWLRLTSGAHAEPAPVWFQHLIVPPSQVFDTIRITRGGAFTLEPGVARRRSLRPPRPERVDMLHGATKA